MPLSKEALKKLVEKIHKEAKPFAGKITPTSGTPFNSAPTGTKPAGHPYRSENGNATTSSSGVGNPAIKEMQRKLIALSKLVLSQMKLADVGKTNQSPGSTSLQPILAPPQPGAGPGQIQTGWITPMKRDTEPSREAVEAGGRGSFGDFLAKRMRQSPVQGVEFDPSPKVTNMANKNPSAPTRLGVIMDTMMRIGGPKAEFSDDGKWGPRTNAALHNAYAFAYSLLKLAKDFELPIRSYSEADLQGFKIPEKDTDMNILDKITTAPILTKHIEAITRMYNEIKTGILENDQYRTYIENDTPFATYGKSKPALGPSGQPAQQPAMLSPREANDIYKVYPKFDISFAGQDGQVQQKPLIITNLVNLQALEAWRKTNGVGLSIPEITKQIRNQISLTPREYTPKQDQAWRDKKWKEEQTKAKAIKEGR